MAKKPRRAPTSAHPGLQIPGFEYDVKGTFLSVDGAGNKASKQSKGVLDLLRIRPVPRPGVRGDVALRFLSSKTLGTHSDILHGSGLHTQPIMELMVGGMPYSIAARYTVRGEKREPIDLGIMIGGGVLPDVRDQNSYSEALHVVTLAVGSAVLKEARHLDNHNASFSLKVSNNFTSGRQPDLVEVQASNITELHRKLDV